MNKLNCDYVREVYPDVLHGRMDGALTLQIREHIATCADCRADAELLELIQSAPVVVPAGLHERVVRAAKSPPHWRVPRSSIALAATIAAVLIGGGVMLRLQDDDAPQPTAHVVAAHPAATPAVHGIGAVGVDDAMLSGKSSLDDLSVEQLEKLLKEVQS